MMRNRIIQLVVGMSIVLLPLLAEASSLAITPAIIDLKAKARDILKESLVLVNDTAKYVEVYPVVNNIAIAEGKQEFLDPSLADHASSLANWIELSRASILLKPGEHKNINFSIEVNLRAKPGNYHALIAFPEGSRRDEAEARIRDAATVTVNIEVLEDIKERLQLKKFVPDKLFFSGFPLSFSYELENAGNRPATPFGEIRIYNRRGEEVGTIEVHAQEKAIAQDTVGKFAAAWQGSSPNANNNIRRTGMASLLFSANSGAGFGRYKAMLDLEYGEKGNRTLQDTVFFWVIPWQKILIIFGGLALIVILITNFLHRRYNQGRNGSARHQGRASPSAGINARIGADRPNVIDLRDIRIRKP